MKIPGYEVIKELGSGGMSVVYLCRHKVLDQLVAVKILHKHLARREDVRERFLTEARLMSHLDHPNLVKVIDFIEFEGSLGFVMEYIKGQSLDHIIGVETGPIPYEKAIPLFKQVLEGMLYAHDKGVIHRDLKPSNVLVGSDGVARIADFGIAKTVGKENFTKTGAKLGTVLYMSPEQITDTKGVDKRADIYSLGMTLYEMLAGRLPFNQEGESSEFEIMHTIIDEHIVSPAEFYPHIPRWLETVVLKSLAIDPSDRFQDCGEFMEALNQQTGQGLGFRKNHPEKQQLQQKRKPVAKLFLGGMITLAALVLLLPRWISDDTNSDVNQSAVGTEETAVAEEMSLPVGMSFIEIPGGSFQMGTAETQLGFQENESPLHEVTLETFQMMSTEVTQSMWWEVMGTTLADMHRADGGTGDLYGEGENHPMYYISYNDCMEFLEQLNRIDDEYYYRLPTEAEWEYAARAGTSTRFFWGDEPLDAFGYSAVMTQYAYYTANTAAYRGDHVLFPVAGLSPNTYGLFDMSGSVSEICEDNWHENYIGAPTDGSAWIASESEESMSCYRVVRGGHFWSSPNECRSGSRGSFQDNSRSPFVGFRVVRIQQ